MKEIVIIGAGGQGREVQWLINRINEKKPTWKLLGYADRAYPVGTLINGIPVLGGDDYFDHLSTPISAVCAVASAKTRKNIISRLEHSSTVDFPNLIDPSVIISDLVELGKGNIICAASVLTVNIRLDNFVHVNVDCKIGHDAHLSSFTTLYPSVNIAGNVIVNECCEIGTGSQVIQGKTIQEGAIIGAGSVVIRDIPAHCTAVGCPAKPIKFHQN